MGKEKCKRAGSQTSKSQRVEESGAKLRIRPESFADHYTQARLFYESLTEFEQRHTVGGFGFELGKLSSDEIRYRVLGHLAVVSKDLAAGVAKALGVDPSGIKAAKPAVAPRDCAPSPALSQYGKSPETLQGKKIGLLVSSGFPARVLNGLKKAAKAEGAEVAIVGLKAGMLLTDGGREVIPDHFLAGAPSVLFDAVVIAPGEESAEELVAQAAAVDWLRDAFAHLKAIGLTEEATAIVEKAGLVEEIAEDEACSRIAGGNVDEFISAARLHRHWDRESLVRPS